MGLLVFFIKSGIKGDITARKIKISCKISSFFGTMETIHANILPLDGERACIANIVECDDDILELDVTMAE